MDGLLTVTHHSANESDMMSMQADLPVLSEHDVHAIRDISSHFEVDFVSLTFTRDGEDIDGMRDFLDKMGLEQTKILAKVSSQHPPPPPPAPAPPPCPSQNQILLEQVLQSTTLCN